MNPLTPIEAAIRIPENSVLSLARMVILKSPLTPFTKGGHRRCLLPLFGKEGYERGLLLASQCYSSERA